MEHDFEKAVEWFRKAAEQNLSDGQSALGLLHVKSLGVDQDLVRGYAWYTIAAANGDRFANEEKVTLKKQMTPEQITEAEALSKNLQKTITVNPKAEELIQ